MARRIAGGWLAAAFRAWLTGGFFAGRADRAAAGEKGGRHPGKSAGHNIVAAINGEREAAV
jgi:hypothetical protein